MSASVQTPETGSAHDVLPFNRRVSIRYPCCATTATRVALQDSCHFRRVRVQNISLGGIGLLLTHPPETGTWVLIRLTNTLLSFTYDLSAETLHAAKQEDGKWLVGCRFSRELTLAELASLL